jgi:hypothetical protein
MTAEEDAEMILVSRMVRKKRGSWWQLPKDFKEQPEGRLIRSRHPFPSHDALGCRRREPALGSTADPRGQHH